MLERKSIDVAPADVLDELIKANLLDHARVLDLFKGLSKVLREQIEIEHGRVS